MRFMMLMKANDDYEAGVPPNPQLLTAIGKLTAEMTDAGVLIGTGGLLPSRTGARVRAARGNVVVTDGPFPETKELIGGYAIVEAPSRADALALARRFLELHTKTLGASYEGECE